MFLKGSVRTSYNENAETAANIEKLGADIIDVGAMSTAPYLDTMISEELEAERIREVIEAVNTGAEILNNITGLSNPNIGIIAAEHDLSLILCAHKI
ncbi:MAG: dihydropteroate synthase [Candidatus Caldarchaeales archaeon]